MVGNEDISVESLEELLRISRSVNKEKIVPIVIASRVVDKRAIERIVGDSEEFVVLCDRNFRSRNNGNMLVYNYITDERIHSIPYYGGLDKNYHFLLCVKNNV